MHAEFSDRQLEALLHRAEAESLHALAAVCAGGEPALRRLPDLPAPPGLPGRTARSHRTPFPYAAPAPDPYGPVLLPPGAGRGEGEEHPFSGMTLLDLTVQARRRLSPARPEELGAAFLDHDLLGLRLLGLERALAARRPGKLLLTFAAAARSSARAALRALPVGQSPALRAELEWVASAMDAAHTTVLLSLQPQ
ncbi:hypothetical protein [Streptomyces sp. ODS28]|uniref:hypothetical protein n=1 Tax=Streptomyces sp. ODS28 TaxID=3136688 RepID=UPI0031E945FA